MRRIALTAVAALVFSGSPGATAAGPSGAATGPNDVAIQDSSYEPGTITVSPGATVTWTHTGSLPHSVTADDGSFDSSPAGCSTSETAGCMSGGQTFQRGFPSLGTFRYYCRVHGGPNGQGMAGTVQVAQAPDPTSVPTSVTSLSGSPVEGGVQVAGTASFGGQMPVEVADDTANDANLTPNVGDTDGLDRENGVDLIGAALSVPDPSQPELLVQWQVAALAPTGGIPEGTLYTLPFKVGTSVYQVQAKYSRLADPDTAADPQGAAGHIGGAFELKGNCTTDFMGTGLARCTHLSWIAGGFDTLNSIVSARVPLGSAAAPGIVGGAQLKRNDSTSPDLNDIIAGYTAASMTNTDDHVPFGDDANYAFTIPTKQVTLGIAASGTDPEEVDFTAPATLAGNDSFAGTISTAGLAPGSFDVYARACFADNCGIRSLAGLTQTGDGTVGNLRLTEDVTDSFVFWPGGKIGNQIPYSLPIGNNATLQSCANSPCFRYALKVASPGAARLRIAIDTARRNDNYFTEVTTPTGSVASKGNSNSFNGEIFIADPPVGTYSILVRPYSAEDTRFTMRAKLEAQIPIPTADENGFILPDLRPSAPYDFGFAAPANGTGSGGDDQNPPLDVGGNHPVSCSMRSETTEEGVTRCLRFSFGLVNAGLGNFDIRWLGDSATMPEGDNYQCVQQAEGPPIARRAGRFEWHESHGHWHFLDLIYTELFSVSNPSTGSMLLRGAGKKLGYGPADQALANWYEFEAGAQGSSGSFGNCRAGMSSNRLGMSIGWGDIYRYQRAGNYVPFEGNPDGLYVLRLTIDPPNGTSDVLEANETNNSSYTYIRVTGDRIEVLEYGRGQSPWDPSKEVLAPRFRGGVPW